MNDSTIILDSWQANAHNWIATIDNNELESRRLVTNDAIITKILSYDPRKVLDLGCGEGWLSRALRKHGIEVYGTDAIKELVDAATAKDGPFYSQYSYEEITAGKHSFPFLFDAIVINFALLDKETSAALIHYLPRILVGGGMVFIQTLHPLVIVSSEAYKSGWKDGNWAGMKRDFVQPYQWYFRTTEDWVKLFTEARYNIKEIGEPVHPDTGKPLSIIFVLGALTSTNKI